METPKSPVLHYSNLNFLRAKVNASSPELRPPFPKLELDRVPFKDESTLTSCENNQKTEDHQRDSSLNLRTIPIMPFSHKSVLSNDKPTDNARRLKLLANLIPSKPVMRFDETEVDEEDDEEIKNTPLSSFLIETTQEDSEDFLAKWREKYIKKGTSLDRNPAGKENPNEAPRIRNAPALQIVKRQPLSERTTLPQDQQPRSLPRSTSLPVKPHYVSKEVQTDRTCQKSVKRGVETHTQTEGQGDKYYTVQGKSYKFLSKIGRGGSSEVYLVMDSLDSSLKALKIVQLKNTDPVSEAGYRNEIELLQKLQHLDLVVKLYSSEFRDDCLLILLERGDTDLAKILGDLRKQGPLSPLQVKVYWSQLLQAVKQIHSAGIIHLDLKPANFIQVSGKLKLIDFGIATALNQDMTSVLKETKLGTINYMAPETLQGCNVGPEGGPQQFKVRTRSDVWSLGCILHNLVYGYPPFHTWSTLYAKMHAITNPHLIKFPTVSDPFLISILKSCLVLDPLKRPSIEELLEHPYLTQKQESALTFELLLSQLRLLTPQEKELAGNVLKE